jgi:hypothetical protein
MKLKLMLASAAVALTAAAPMAAYAERAPAPATAAKTKAAPLTKEQVLAAQQAWGEALVRISTIADTQGAPAAKKEAEKVLDAAYGYNLGPVLFKPTLTTAPNTFRTTRDGALAYFVGGDAKYPDTGFALKHWRSFKIENAAVFMDGDVAMTMGNVHLTDKDGNVTTVDKTWGYKRDADGNLRIVLHHSSLPYKPN